MKTFEEDKYRYFIEALVDEDDFDTAIKLIDNFSKEKLALQKKEILKQPHKTLDGYCCACDYDIACMNERLEDQKHEIIEKIEDKIMEYKDDYDIQMYKKKYRKIFCPVLEYKIKALEDIIKLII